jgi:FixJ family two-component response regulator
MSSSPTTLPVVSGVALPERMTTFVRETCASSQLDFVVFPSQAEFLQSTILFRFGCAFVHLENTSSSGFAAQFEHLLDRLKVIEAVTAIVLVAEQVEVRDVVKAIRKGACDFLCGDSPPADWESAIQESANTSRIRDELRRERLLFNKRMSELTEQESAVLSHLLQGRTNKEISADLGVALRTVQFRRASIMEKLHATTFAELVRYVTRFLPGA